MLTESEITAINRPLSSSAPHHSIEFTSKKRQVTLNSLPSDDVNLRDPDGLQRELKTLHQPVEVFNDFVPSNMEKQLSANLTASVVVFPIFVKLHVVGSSTFTSMLRCLAMSRGLAAFKTLGNGYWDSKLCGQEQGHQAAELFKMHGARALSCCIKEDSFRQVPGAKIRLVALLRHPVEKYISSLYTFVQGDVKQLLLKTPPHEVTVDRFNAAADNVWGNRSAIKFITDSRKRATARLNLENQMRVRGSMHEIRDIFRKTEHLRAFDVVGVTEKYDQFLVLVELVIQWPIGALCFRKKLHSNPLR